MSVYTVCHYIYALCCRWKAPQNATINRVLLLNVCKLHQRVIDLIRRISVRRWMVFLSCCCLYNIRLRWRKTGGMSNMQKVVLCRRIKIAHIQILGVWVQCLCGCSMYMYRVFAFVVISWIINIRHQSIRASDSLQILCWCSVCRTVYGAWFSR